MTRRAEIAARLPFVFGLGRADAAAAIGISSPTFDKLVDEGKMPKPRLIGTRKLWDVDELRAAFKSLPRDDDEGEIDTWADVA
jgi:predicted DNA-binding transcriptional regulator AlpA